ncbi:hypothetical protein FACS189460_3060 [Deltaproteobacteria bacterium]|nr:hypothetical protein FACS189460_3060 [Deltaproteobacteria bacterium]
MRVTKVMKNGQEFSVGGSLGAGGGVGKHLGEPFFYPANTPPPGAIKARGETFSRAVYADLWQWAQANGLVIAEADWQAQAAAQNGFCPLYSDGDGSATFRAPFYGRYFGAAATDDEVGTWAGDAIRNITGGIRPTLSANANGAFAGTNEATAGLTATGGSFGPSAWGATSFDASRVVPTANENRPKTCYLAIYIHAHDVATTLAQAETQEVLNALNGKVDKAEFETTNYSGAFPAATAINITSGYVAPCDGWFFINAVIGANGQVWAGVTSAGGQGSRFFLMSLPGTLGICTTVPFSKGESIYFGTASNVINAAQFIPAKGAA